MKLALHRCKDSEWPFLIFIYVQFCTQQSVQILNNKQIQWNEDNTYEIKIR